METDESSGSVTRWIGDLKGGDDQAAQALWRRYFDPLVRLARDRLNNVPRAAADEEDVALSVLNRVFRGAAEGKYPEVGDRDALWGILAKITVDKAIDQRRKERALKRGGGKTRGQADLADGDSEVDLLAQAPDRGPSPELAALIDEQFQHLLARLGKDDLRKVAVWKMEGYGNEEIARRLDCGLRTVERKLEVIRALWEADRPG